jgi:uncharacterized DUF497 family protein
MTRTYNYESMKRHCVTVDEINEVQRSPLTVIIDLEPSDKGNDRVVWIGFTFSLRLLEIGVEYLPNDNEHMFHTMDATKTHRKEFEQSNGAS